MRSKHSHEGEPNILKGEVDIWDGLDIYVEEIGKETSKLSPEDPAYEIARMIEIERAKARLAERDKINANLRAEHAKLSKVKSANGRKGAKAKKRNAPKDEETKRLKAALFMEMRKPSNLSERSRCANFARAHVLKVATVRSWWIEHKNEKRGRHNTNRDGESNS